MPSASAAVVVAVLQRAQVVVVVQEVIPLDGHTLQRPAQSGLVARVVRQVMAVRVATRFMVPLSLAVVLVVLEQQTPATVLLGVVAEVAHELPHRQH